MQYPHHTRAHWAPYILAAAMLAAHPAQAQMADDAATERPALAPVAVGLHLGAWHSDPTACQPVLTRCESITPGAYIQTAGGWLAGGYRNSLGRPTVYAGRILWHWQRGGWALDVAGVLATGYPAAAVVPLVTPTVTRWDRAGRWGVSVGYLPRLGRANPTHVLHFELVRAL